MSQQQYTFDQLPSIVAMLAAEIKELKALLTEQGALQKHDPN
jgi:hypothetical protein